MVSGPHRNRHGRLGPPASGTALQDVAVVQQPVQHRTECRRIAEQFSPVVDGAVRRQQGAGPFVGSTASRRIWPRGAPKRSEFAWRSARARAMCCGSWWGKGACWLRQASYWVLVAPATLYGAIAAFLEAVAVVAMLVPSVRATRVSPVARLAPGRVTTTLCHTATPHATHYPAHRTKPETISLITNSLISSHRLASHLHIGKANCVKSTLKT
jgi:hypothetical protein